MSCTGYYHNYYMANIERFCRVKEEVDQLVALLVVLGEDDPRLQALRSELEEKALQAHKLVCANRYTNRYTKTLA